MRIIAFFLALLMTGPVHAQQRTDPDPEQADALEQEADANRLEAQRLRLEAEAYTEDAESSRRRVKTLAESIAAHEEDLRRTRDRLAELASREAAARDRLRDRRAAYAEAFDAMVALSKAPAPAIFAHAGRPVDAARGGMLLGALGETLETDATMILSALGKIDSLRREGEAAKSRAEDAIGAIRAEEKALRDLIRRRTRESETAIQAADRLERESEALAVRAEALKPFIESAPIPRARPYRAPVQPAAPVHSASLGAAPAPQAAPAITNPFLARPPLDSAYGKMRIPVLGSVLIPFGGNLPNGAVSEGILFEGPAHSRVYAPWGGDVIFTGQVETFGLVVMIDVGEGGMLVLAGMRATDLRKGDQVLPGQPMGRLGGPVGRNGEFLAEGGPNAMSSLYFEFRRNEKPVDPAPWLEAGRLAERR